MTSDPASDPAVPLQALAPQLVPGGGQVRGLTRLSGGASQETWAFDLVDAAGTALPLILRRPPHGGQRDGGAIGQMVEAAVIMAARAAGVPAPQVLLATGADTPLGEACIMERVAGETLAPRILKAADLADARSRLAGQCGAALARLHAAPLDTLPPLPVSGPLDQMARYRAILHDLGAERPVLELGFAWLAAHAPAPRAPVLVHGDFRNGNLVVDADGLAAVLDWELAHLGDPREDLGWLCVNSWRFGMRDAPVGGFGRRQDLLDAYAAAGGALIAPRELHWFELLGTVTWGVMCLMMQAAHASGLDPGIERAMIGRRTSEAEMDVLHLLDEAPAP